MSYRYLSKKILVFSFVFYLTACTNNSSNLSVPESDYSTRIIGNWEGTVGELNETMTLHRDSTFVCHTSGKGFIANTLSQTLPGTIRGRWLINGKKITMEVTSERNEQVANKINSSTIIAFKQDSLILKPDLGDITVFKRAFQLIKK
ncbi:MAG: hypothetical protein ABI315_06435 [Bacteroidia bacterium]